MQSSATRHRTTLKLDAVQCAHEHFRSKNTHTHSLTPTQTLAHTRQKQQHSDPTLCRIMGLNETLVNVLVTAVAHTIGSNLLESSATAASATNGASVTWTTTTSTTDRTQFATTNQHRSFATAAVTSLTTAPSAPATATPDNGSADAFDDRARAVLASDTAAHFVAQLYGKLLQPSIMNTFNVSLEYIESSTTPDAALAAAATGDGIGGGGGAGDAITAALNIGAVLGLLCKCVIMSFIILAAIFGNMLVIVSVMQHRRLR